jgi:hypothetical protein
VQLAWGAAAVLSFVAAGLLQETRPTQSDLWDVVPGRAFVVNALWIRADRLKEEGRHYDALQQSLWICRLQRRYPGAWSFLAWNMAWNISVATHTPEERWRWVYNGIRLLRDEGIPLNRKSVLLYKDLGWIFLFKMGDYLDDMHWVYKRQWAMRMQDLLGAPPQGPTEEVIAAFAPVADEAFLDKDLNRQGLDVIQGEKLRGLLADPKVKAYADLLAEVGVAADEGLLAAYNRYSLDEPVRAVRIKPPAPKADKDQAVFAAINHPHHAEARARLLAFVRAQVLWNVFKMDPRRMLALMKEYDAPLDWRLPEPHGLYWLKLGLDMTEDKKLRDVDTLNTQRNALNCLKVLTWRGRMTIVDERPRESSDDALSLEPVRAESDMQLPQIRIQQLADIRYIRATHQEFMRGIRAMIGDREDRFQTNKLATGHINYLSAAVKTLYAAYRRKEAQQLLDWIRQKYGRKGLEWGQQDVDDFVLYELRRETQPNRDLAETQITMSLLVGFVALARGDQATFDEAFDWATRVHRVYQKGRGERMRLARFEWYVLTIATRLIGEPRGVGYNLTLVERSALYRSMPGSASRAVFGRAGKKLKAECEAEGLDFQKAFPPPPPQQRQQGAPLIPGLAPGGQGMGGM